MDLFNSSLQYWDDSNTDSDGGKKYTVHETCEAVISIAKIILYYELWLRLLTMFTLLNDTLHSYLKIPFPLICYVEKLRKTRR